MCIFYPGSCKFTATHWFTATSVLQTPLFISMTMGLVSGSYAKMSAQAMHSEYVDLPAHWKCQSLVKDSQTINRQSSRWAEITVDNDDNKRIKESIDSRGEAQVNGIRQKRQDGGTRCLNISSLESKSPSLQYSLLMIYYIIILYPCFHRYWKNRCFKNILLTGAMQ